MFGSYCVAPKLWIVSFQTQLLPPPSPVQYLKMAFILFLSPPPPPNPPSDFENVTFLF